MKQENISLKRNIKFYAESIEQEQEKARERKLLDDRTSDNQFSASMSNAGPTSAGGFDMHKIEKINKHVFQMMNAKQSFDCAMSILKACKEAFKGATRCTLFIVDQYLQAIILKGQTKMQRHFKSVALEDTMSGVMFAIFD